MEYIVAIRSNKNVAGLIDVAQSRLKEKKNHFASAKVERKKERKRERRTERERLAMVRRQLGFSLKRSR